MTPLQMRRYLNSLRPHHRHSAARADYVHYPFDGAVKPYAAWNGRYRFLKGKK